jgi:hypothetical protein
MAGCADASFHLGDVAAAGQQKGYPVAVFYPGVAGCPDGRVGAQDMQQLGPEPFGGIDAADELQVVGRKGSGMGVDGGGLFDGGMVFPQHEEGVGIVAEFGQQSQRGTGLVYGDGGRSGGIDGDGCYVAGCGGAGLSEAGCGWSVRVLRYNRGDVGGTGCRRVCNTGRPSSGGSKRRLKLFRCRRRR